MRGRYELTPPSIPTDNIENMIQKNIMMKEITVISTRIEGWVLNPENKSKIYT